MFPRSRLEKIAFLPLSYQPPILSCDKNLDPYIHMLWGVKYFVHHLQRLPQRKKIPRFFWVHIPVTTNHHIGSPHIIDRCHRYCINISHGTHVVPGSHTFSITNNPAGYPKLWQISVPSGVHLATIVGSSTAGIPALELSQYMKPNHHVGILYETASDNWAIHGVPSLVYGNQPMANKGTRQHWPR